MCLTEFFVIILKSLDLSYFLKTILYRLHGETEQVFGFNLSFPLYTFVQVLRLLYFLVNSAEQFSVIDDFVSKIMR